MAEPTVTEESSATPGDGSRNKLVIGLLLCSAFVVILNETIMSVALPVLIDDLGISARTAQWVATGFLLTMAVVIPTTGFIQQRFTTRQIFIGAMSTFCLGTLIAGLAPGFTMLMVGRVVQACGTAVMMPLLMTTVLVLVPVERRGQTMGVVTVVISVAPALGPTISGVILQFLSWRWLFLIVLPIAAFMTVLGAKKMVNVSAVRKLRLDVASVILAALGFGGLVYALNQIGGDAGGPAILIVSSVACVIGLIGFVWRQLSLQRDDSALMDLRVFTFSNFSLGVGVLMIAFAGLLGVAILWPLFLQQVRGLSTLSTGLLLLPGGLMMGFVGPLVGRLYDRIGPRPLVVPAGFTLAIAILTMSFAGPTTSLPVLLVSHLLLSASLGFILTPTFTHALNDLPPRLYAHGSAALSTLQQVAGAAGTALLITVLANRAAAIESLGFSADDANAAGLRLAFIVGAGICATVPVVAFFFRPRTTP